MASGSRRSRRTKRPLSRCSRDAGGIPEAPAHGPGRGGGGGRRRVPLGAVGCRWVPLGAVGCRRVPLGAAGCRWVPLAGIPALSARARGRAEPSFPMENKPCARASGSCSPGIYPGTGGGSPGLALNNPPPRVMGAPVSAGTRDGNGLRRGAEPGMGQLGSAGNELGSAWNDVGCAGGSWDILGGELGNNGMELGSTGIELGYTGVELGCAWGELEAAGGELGVYWGELGRAGGELGCAGVN